MSSSKKTQSKPIKSRLICYTLRGLSMIPMPISRWVGRSVAKIQYTFKTKVYRFRKYNIEKCLPELSSAEQEQLIKKSLLESSNLLAEIPRIWCKPCIADWIGDVYGAEAVQETLDSGKGVLITGSHIGNWEVALFHLGMAYDFHCMYRPPRFVEMQDMISEGRCKNNTTMVKGNVRGVMSIIKALNEGKVTALLSDQEPGKNAGVFAPFFGKPAYTMTLIQSMSKKSNSDMYQVAAIRRADYKFDIHLVPVDVDNTLDEMSFAKELNTHLESVIRMYPEQYQWCYRRFKTNPEGAPHPYRALKKRASLKTR